MRTTRSHQFELLAMILLLLGCPSHDPGGPPDTGPTDADGDGYCRNEDCDDDDASVHPGATEIPYDGIDQDCDGDDLTDVDGDGFDSDLAGGDDCDDGDSTVTPSADEVCDGIDNDCDGTVDPDSSLEAPAWYADSDSDGYGDPNSTTTSCAQPPGHVSDDTDCDDGDSSVNPDATETWYDGLDQNCDGASDYDADGDDYDSDGYGGTDCDDGDISVNPDAEEVCGNGIDDDCDGSGGYCDVSDRSLADADAKFTGEENGSGVDTSVARAGDVDADGLDDLLVGADIDDTVYLILGSTSTADMPLADADAVFVGEQDHDAAGSGLSGAGDFDGDGFHDVVVGARQNDGGGYHAGAAYLVLGSASPSDLSLEDADAKFTGEMDDDKAGCSVAGAGDVDGDGFGDLLVGAYGSDSGGIDAGAAYLILGSATPSHFLLSDADALLIGEADDDRAGITVSRAGDFDGDGFEDLLVGAYKHDGGGEDAGAAYLVLGSPALATMSLADADALLAGEHADDYAGASVAGAGDVNCDGFEDILVGAPRDDTDGDDGGAAYLLLGAASPVSLMLDEANAKFTDESGEAGTDVAGAGDVDGDGFEDMLIGTPWHRDGEFRGFAALVLGSGSLASISLSDADARLVGEDVEEDYVYAGYSLDGAGDVNGDDLDDVLVGSLCYADSEAGACASPAYLVMFPGL